MVMHLNKIVQGIKFAKSYLIKRGMPCERNKNIFKKPKKGRDNKKEKNSFQECIRSRLPKRPSAVQSAALTAEPRSD